MKPQGQGQMLYRGSDNKKTKPSKAEKVFNAMQKMKLRTAASKKEASA